MMELPKNMSSLIAILRTERIAHDISAYCNADKNLAATIRTDADSVNIAPSIVNGGADIVVIETGPVNESEIQTLEQLCAHIVRGGALLAIMENPSADAVRRLFRAGVTDILSSSASGEDIEAALNAARGSVATITQSDPHAAGKIITVMKTAGGVGATTLALNVASSFTRLQHEPVIIADLDVQFGQVATALDIVPKMTVLDALRASNRLDPTLLSSILYKHGDGLLALAAPPTMTPLEAIDGGFIEKLFENLRKCAAVSIVEIPAAWTDWVGEVASRSDLIVAVAEANVRSAAGAARISQSLIDFGLVKTRPAVVINKFEKTLENSERAKYIGEIFKTKPLAAIAHDPRVATEAADRGLLINDVAPKSQLSKTIDSLTEKFAGLLDIEMGDGNQMTPPRERLLGGRLRLGSNR